MKIISVFFTQRTRETLREFHNSSSLWPLKRIRDSITLFLLDHESAKLNGAVIFQLSVLRGLVDLEVILLKHRVVSFTFCKIIIKKRSSMSNSFDPTYKLFILIIILYGSCRFAPFY